MAYTQERDKTKMTKLQINFIINIFFKDLVTLMFNKLNQYLQENRILLQSCLDIENEILLEKPLSI
jgi:hypothetical protein